jgi:hypothetical protein
MVLPSRIMQVASYHLALSNNKAGYEPPRVCVLLQLFGLIPPPPSQINQPTCSSPVVYTQLIPPLEALSVCMHACMQQYTHFDLPPPRKQPSKVCDTVTMILQH